MVFESNSFIKPFPTTTNGIFNEAKIVEALIMSFLPFRMFQILATAIINFLGASFLLLKIEVSMPLLIVKILLIYSQ